MRVWPGEQTFDRELIPFAGKIQGPGRRGGAGGALLAGDEFWESIPAVCNAVRRYRYPTEARPIVIEPGF